MQNTTCIIRLTYLGKRDIINILRSSCRILVFSVGAGVRACSQMRVYRDPCLGYQSSVEVPELVIINEWEYTEICLISVFGVGAGGHEFSRIRRNVFRCTYYYFDPILRIWFIFFTSFYVFKMGANSEVCPEGRVTIEWVTKTVEYCV